MRLAPYRNDTTSSAMAKIARIGLFLSGFALSASILASPSAPAEETQERKGTFSFVLENDLFYDADRHYTNGVGFIWVPDRHVPAPGWVSRLAQAIPWFPRDGVVRHGYAFGQSMFTPGDITLTNPPLTDRPYAGWLYGTFGLASATPNRLDLFTLSVGMVGPAALGEPTQKFVHHVVGANQPQGWSTQIGNEPGLVLDYKRSWRSLAKARIGGGTLDVTPYVGGALGNIFTYGDAGVMLRFGDRLPSDFGPPRIQPGLLGSGEFNLASGFDWYLFAGIEGRGVARNIFLDGNTFRDSRSVDKLPWVGDAQYGFVVEWPEIRLSYTHVLRTREYHSQSGADNFGALAVSVKF